MVEQWVYGAALGCPCAEGSTVLCSCSPAVLLTAQVLQSRAPGPAVHCLCPLLNHKSKVLFLYNSNSVLNIVSIMVSASVFTHGGITNYHSACPLPPAGSTATHCTSALLKHVQAVASPFSDLGVHAACFKVEKESSAGPRGGRRPSCWGCRAAAPHRAAGSWPAGAALPPPRAESSF